MKTVEIDGETKYYIEEPKTVRGITEMVRYFATQDKRSKKWMIVKPTEDGHMALQECDENGKLIKHQPEEIKPVKMSFEGLKK
jgi:hypothetical protein